MILVSISREADQTVKFKVKLKAVSLNDIKKLDCKKKLIDFT